VKLASIRTAAGAGHAHKPARYLAGGMELVTRVNGIGECRNIMMKGT
jgi:acylpyruvate hydrolase